MVVRLVKLILLLVLVTVAFLASGIALRRSWYRYHYPYGFSHCCENALYLALVTYADKHDGAFPAGEATPEASLSLLYREKIDGYHLADANVLRGKTVPQSVVQEILERGELLTPETCGWHYVEGLRIDDDSRLALFWDKTGLDHNGGRLKGGGHVVQMIHSERKHVPGSEWEQFLAEQRKLFSQRRLAQKRQ